MNVTQIGIILAFVTIVRGSAYIRSEWCRGDYFRNAAIRCAAAHGTSEVDFQDYLHFRPAKSEAAKCLKACIFDECKLFNADHTFSLDLPGRAAYVSSHGNWQVFKVMEQVGNYCVQHIRTGENTCESAEALLKCYAANLPFPVSLEGALQ